MIRSGPPGDHTPGIPEDGLQLRAGFLRLNSVLHDRITGLDAYHLHIDDLHLIADERSLGVIAIDLPNLSHLESMRGWEMSDRLLTEVAHHLKGLCGTRLPGSARVTLDSVHGNSFLIFLHETASGGSFGPGELAAAADQVVRGLAPLRQPGGNAPSRPRIDFTVGFGLVSGNSAARFERRLHQAIRNAWVMTIRHGDRRSEELARELHSILTEARVTTHYQPIVDMEQGTIMGYEALTRGPSNSTFEVPEALFSDANAPMLLSELDVLCRRQAVRNARGIDPRKKLFLNSRPDTLPILGAMEDDFFSSLAEIPLPPHNIVIEITERSPIRDFEAFGRELAPLRRRGFLVAIDDVGTGYSSLQTISEVQPDYLKVDISLIKNIHRSLIKQDLVHSLLQIASRIGARVIAEGIESREEYRALRRCGVRYGQGFYFAPPAPPFPAIARRGAETEQR